MRGGDRRKDAIETGACLMLGNYFTHTEAFCSFLAEKKA
jgi:hypothetical protein